MLQLNMRELPLKHLLRDPPPQPRIRQHIPLIRTPHRRRPPTPTFPIPPHHLCQRRRHPRTPLHLRPRIPPLVTRHLPILHRALHLLPEIRPATVLPQHHEIHPLAHLPLQRTPIDQALRVKPARPYIRERADMVPQREQPTLRVRPRVVPLRPADGPEQDRVDFSGLLEDLRRDGDAVLVDGAAAGEAVGGGEGVAERVFEHAEDFEGFGHDFGADVVAGEDEDGAGGGLGAVGVCGGVGRGGWVGDLE